MHYCIFCEIYLSGDNLPQSWSDIFNCDKCNSYYIDYGNDCVIFGGINVNKNTYVSISSNSYNIFTLTLTEPNKDTDFYFKTNDYPTDHDKFNLIKKIISNIEFL